MNYRCLMMLFFTFSSAAQTKLPAAAICIVPVSDLLSERFSPTPSVTSADFYAALPLSERRPLAFCCRATQLLFNEQVLIIQERNDQSFVEVPFWHVKTPSTKSPSKKNNRFWTLSKNLCRTSFLSPQSLKAIPNETSLSVVTLSLPWHCVETATTYSAGTSFILLSQKKGRYRVCLIHPLSFQPIEIFVPFSHAVSSRARSEKEQRALLVKTAREWAHGIPHQIPYVLGGASIVQTFTLPAVEEEMSRIGKIKGSVFNRLECAGHPKTGLDCAGFIRLACKVAGIPFSATNSKTITHSLRTLHPDEPIQNGDILAWRGHVALITDVQKGLIAEARGYEHFYGYVQEIPYAEQLKGIHTTQELKKASAKRKSVARLDKKGMIREIITDLTVLSLWPSR